MPDQLTDQQIAEIEARELTFYCNKCGWFGTNGPAHPRCNYHAMRSPADITIGALIATVKQLRTTLSNADRVVVEAVKVNGDLQSQLEQLRAVNERLRAELEKESLTADAYAADADVGDSFRSRAVDLCNQKAAEYERAMRHRKTREAFTKTYADAVSEIRKALEAH